MSTWKRKRKEREQQYPLYKQLSTSAPQHSETDQSTTPPVSLMDKESIKHLLTRETPYPKLILHRMEPPRRVPHSTIQKEENVEEFWNGRNASLQRKMARNDFSEFNLQARIMKRLISKKYWTPTPIQSKALPLILAGHHCIIQAQTGTGKTLAYVLPALQLRDPRKRNQILVIVPSRELGEQVLNEFKILLPKPNLKEGYHYKIKEQALLVSRAEPYDYHVDMIQSSKPSIVVGTAHRIKELLADGILDPAKVEYVVLDEADHLLDPLKKTAKTSKLMHRARHPKPTFTLLKGLFRINPQLQLVAVGATLNQQLRYQLKTLCAPKKVEVVTAGNYLAIPEGITHSIILSPERRKIATLVEYIKANKGVDGGFLIFLKAGSKVVTFTQALVAAGVKAVPLHQYANYRKVRKPFLQMFKSGEIDCAVATELVGRGLDFHWLTRVILVDIPTDTRNYIHLSGRVGRNGSLGESVTLLTESEREQFKKIVKHTKTSFRHLNASGALLEEGVTRLPRIASPDDDTPDDVDWSEPTADLVDEDDDSSGCFADVDETDSESGQEED